MLAATVVLLAACGSASSSAAEDDTALATGSDATAEPATPSAGEGEPTAEADTSEAQPNGPVDVLENGLTKPVPSIPDGDVTELQIEDLVVGDGAEAVPGSTVSVHYVGVHACTGSQFDASWDRGSTFDFVLGARSVIYGWDAGVEGMKVGGRRQLTIPSHFAYGAVGSGSGSIGPDADLVFVVDLIAVEDTQTELSPITEPVPDPTPPANPDKPAPTLPDGPITSLVIEDLVVGDGDEATDGKFVEVNYVGVLACNGYEFDASWNRDATFFFALGQGQVIPGWDEGVEGMKVGGRRQIEIPADQAYGEQGSGPIPPSAAIIFVVDLVSVADPADPEDEPALDLPDELTGELEITDLVEGEGPALLADQTVTAQFWAARYETGEIVQSTWQEGGYPVSLSTGSQTMPGLAQGLIGMRAGGLRQIIIPPALAFAETGQDALGIGPDETIVIMVQLVALNGA